MKAYYQACSLTTHVDANDANNRQRHNSRKDLTAVYQCPVTLSEHEANDHETAPGQLQTIASFVMLNTLRALRFSMVQWGLCGCGGTLVAVAKAVEKEEGARE